MKREEANLYIYVFERHLWTDSSCPVGLSTVTVFCPSDELSFLRDAVPSEAAGFVLAQFRLIKDS